MKKIIIFLSIAVLFFIKENVYAATCQYNDGGISCCKKASLVNLNEGETISKTPIKEKNAYKCGSSFSDCGRNDCQDTKMGGNTQNTKKLCDDKNGKTLANGTIKLDKCHLSSKQGYHFCRCVKHYLIVNTCITKYECPKGTIDDGKGTHCISDYLTKLIEMTNATGTCTQNRKDTFDTCRY